MSLVDWKPLDWTPAATMAGRYAQMARLHADHAAPLHAAFGSDGETWRYMPYGPFADAADYAAWVTSVADRPDPVFYVIADGEGWAGVASLMRVDRAHGVIEIGNIALTPHLRRTPAATEAMHLMIDHAFQSGFRRMEWKCNALNAPSRRAALRYGFTYEGTFRQHMVVKGQNRDTAWFAITDGDWPTLRAGHQSWLAPANFDAAGAQIKPLSDFLPTP